MSAEQWTGNERLRPFLVQIDKLEPFPGNPRRGDVQAVRESLRRFGQVRPILTDGARIVAGHHLVLAAKEEGWSHVAALENEFGDDEEARAYLLADNRTGQLGGFDDELLLAQLQAASEASTLEGTGYDSGYVAELEAQLREAAANALSTRDPEALNEAPPVPEGDPESQTGEVYELGPHRLLCGDAREPGALAQLLDGEKADLLWTDPPYGVDYVGKTKDALTLKNDDASGLPDLLTRSLRAAGEVLRPSSPFYIAAPAGPRGTTFRVTLEELGWRFHEALVWVKDVFVLGYSDYHYRHEDILYGYTPGEGRPGRGDHAGSRWQSDHAQDSVFEIPRPRRSSEHPTMKPVELVSQMIRNSSEPGQIVLDPFAGSGSTLIAADTLGRRCFMADLDRHYCDVIRKRYADYDQARQNLSWSAPAA